MQTYAITVQTRQSFTLVWDMNKLFEEFVYETLKRRSNIAVSAQKGRRLLKNVNNKIRNTYVDILITNPERIVIDTKYKELKTVKDFENKDVFQVVTYCMIHNTNKAVLIYPQVDNNKICASYELNIDEKICPFSNINNFCDKQNVNYNYTIKFLTITFKYKLNKKNIGRLAKILVGRIFQSCF